MMPVCCDNPNKTAAGRWYIYSANTVYVLNTVQHVFDSMFALRSLLGICGYKMITHYAAIISCVYVCVESKLLAHEQTFTNVNSPLFCQK